MKGCELCGGVARMYCESDQASLCWSCDEKVHSANFLVAKHCRILLCQVCQSPTPWKASGPKLGPTVSICESCFSSHNHNNHAQQQQQQQGRDIDHDDEEESFGGNDELDSDDDGDDDFSDQDDDDEEEEEEEEEDGDNQVVPWSVTAPSPPPVASSSSSEGEEEEEISSKFLGGSAGSLKRARENGACIDSDDEIGCSYTQMGSGRLSSNDELESCRPLKQQRRRKRVGGEAEEEEDHHHHHLDHDGQEESRSTAIIDSLKRLQSQMVANRENASATIVGICRLSRDHHSR